MRYAYKCNKCHTEVVINKPMTESSKTELCPSCKEIMVRDYKVSVSTGDGFKG